ncbi:P-loop containing nucleoside triphosphate hydrolase protein [Lyophyllum atratum]|nr:P-loop containing nucleoside triphosphate hydrolase protein [Lyophyllum atratum]
MRRRSLPTTFALETSTTRPSTISNGLHPDTVMTKNPNIKYTNTWKEEEVRPSDNFMKDPKKTDLVVPVMGATGAGKSTFINALVGQDVAKVGHGLQSETAQVQHYILPHPRYPDRRLIVVDTPGFDDTNQDDREILRRIAVWLAQSYDADMTLAGVIYLHEITLTRMTGTARKNLDMFDKLCGPNAGPNIILATTKWNEVKKKVGARREKELRATQWKEMIGHGSRMSRFEDSQKSAKAIIKLILKREPVDVAQIQRELVENDTLLSDTEAGRTLRYTLEEMLEVQRQKVARLREEGGQDLQEEIANEENIRAMLNQIKSLNTQTELAVDQKIAQALQTKAVEDLREIPGQGLETQLKQVVRGGASVLDSETAAKTQHRASSSRVTTTNFANAAIGAFQDAIAGIYRKFSDLNASKTGVSPRGEKLITQDRGVIILYVYY